MKLIEIISRYKVLIIIIGLMVLGYFIGFFSGSEHDLKNQSKFYAYQINNSKNFIPALMGSSVSCVNEIIDYHKRQTDKIDLEIIVPKCFSYSLKPNIPVYIIDTIDVDIIEVGYFTIDQSGLEDYHSGYIYRNLIHTNPYK